MITDIAFCVYPVTEMPRAREFYEAVLGLKPETIWEDRWVEYDVKGSTFAITTVDMTHQPGAKGGIVAFEVDELDAELGRLKERGVKFVLETYESPVCRFAVVADPDGNEVIIHKRKA